jgi:protein O-GlcNAc transferase
MWVSALVLSVMVGIGCNKTDKVAASTDGGKIPITTTSDEARKEFLTGRDLSERLLGQEAVQHFDKALALDPEFAAAELGRANTSPTAKEFFEHLKKAVALAPKSSNGEKLLILSNQAGANGVVEIQKEYLDQLVTAYPNDERAQFNLGNYYFGQQDLDQALARYKKTVELAPNYSQVYNLMGYCLRQKGDYADSEASFKKYIELIPNDPNPYGGMTSRLRSTGRRCRSIRTSTRRVSEFRPT